MKNLLITIALLLLCNCLFAQPYTLTVDASGNLNYSKLIATSNLAQSFFTGHESGTTYQNNAGIFRGITDNTTYSAQNYFYDGVLGSTTTYSIRADGQGYFAGNINVGVVYPAGYTYYSGVITNNATNGGFIDFRQNNTMKGQVVGDLNGLSLIANTSLPVHIYSNAQENMTILSNGNVGIGQTAPIVKLQVNGPFITSNINTANLDPSNNNTSGIQNISFLSGTGQMLAGWNRSGGEGEADFIANRSTGTNGGFAFYDYNNSNVQTELMRVRSTGQVLIGVSNFATSPQYSNGVNMLAVAGGIETDAITVKLQGAPWPDYVFKPKYTLQPLSEVKAYIDQNHHLPEMPSEADIYKNGQNLGEMNKLLVKKVEELTLYMMEINKKLIKQEVRIKQLQINNQKRRKRN